MKDKIWCNLLKIFKINNNKQQNLYVNMKKLFATLVFLCVALAGWSIPAPAQISSTWDETTKTLTINYQGGDLKKGDLDRQVGGPAEGIKGNVKKLVLQGVWTNTQLKSDDLTKFINEKCLGNEPNQNNSKTLYLDLSGCTALQCKYTGINDDGTYFTFEPVGGTQQVTVTNYYKKVEETGEPTYSYSVNNDPFEDFPENAVEGETYPYPGWYGDENSYIAYDSDEGKWYIAAWGGKTWIDKKEEQNVTVTWYEYDMENEVIGDELTDLSIVSELTQSAEDPTIYYKTYTDYIELSGFGFGDYKTNLNGITFPDNSNFTFIPNGLCKELTNLQTVVMPNNIVAIERNAFKGCTALANVTWSTGLQYIGLLDVEKDNGIFEGCTSLPAIDLSGCTSLEVLGRGAFKGTSAATSVSLPSSLKVIGGEAFANSGLTSVNLSGCTALETMAYECFEDCAALTTITFPAGSTLTHIGNDAFQRSGLTSVDMSMCTGITEFQANPTSGDYKTFWKCTSLTSIILPPNISAVPGNQGLFKDCSALASVTFTGTAKYEGGAFVNPLVIENAAFSELTELTEVNFSNNLLRIEANAFNKCDIINVELQECHELVEIQEAAFKDCLGMINVDLCSHPKVIRTEAFRNIHSIKKVEIHGCENTCMTEVICENRGFEWDITHYQTAAPTDIMDNVAELIFPKDGSVCDDANYTSAWDYFVGDYKNGALITQENLLCYYRYVPQSGASTTKVVGYVFDEDGNQVFNEDGTPKTQDYNNVPVECQYQTGNGWHEFIKVGFGEIIQPGEFLRTYSRTAGDGPCLLPNQVIAYRAIDYKSTKVGYVKDRNGDWYCVDTAQPEESREYIQITDDTPASDYAGKTRFSKLTIGGILYLRPLIAKVASYNGTEGYTEANKEYFDSEEVYQNLDAVDGNLSYVPENTGVVLYSNLITQEAFLMLPGDFGTENVYKQFPHTGDRYEEARRANGEDDDINMLHGSYGTGWTVAPVYPWLFKGQSDETSGDIPADETTYTAGHYSYTTPKAYRNFACTVTSTNTETGKKTYGWKRLQPSVLKVNRAFAQIPVNRFDNFNETVDQMPDFTLEDEITDDTSSNLLVINMFEYENDGAGVDGIKTVNTVENNVDNNGWYTLQGVRVLNPNKGVYIHNGQKVVIK